MESATVYEPMFSYENRRYILLQMANGVIRRVKVPFRYNRVMCEVRGDKTIQELVRGDTVQVSLEFVGGVWKCMSIKQAQP